MDKPTYNPLRRVKIIRAQMNAVFFQIATPRVSQSNTKFRINFGELL